MSRRWLFVLSIALALCGGCTAGAPRATLEALPSAEAYYRRGMAHLHQGESALALPDFARAAELKPEDVTAWDKLAFLYFHRRDYPQAVAHFTRAIELDPENVEIYYGRGVSYVELGDYGAALADLTHVIEREPDKGLAYHARGFVYYAQGDHARALDDLRAYVALEGLAAHPGLVDLVERLETEATP